MGRYAEELRNANSGGDMADKESSGKAGEAGDGAGEAAYGARSGSPPRGTPPSAAKNDAARTIYVGHVAYETNERTLFDYFERYGRVQSTKIIIDHETGRSKGYGFVTFEDVRSCDDAMQEANGKTLDGRVIKVGPPRPEGRFGDSGGRGRGRGRGFDDFGGGRGRGRGFGGRGGGRYGPPEERFSPPPMYDRPYSPYAYGGRYGSSPPPPDYGHGYGGRGGYGSPPLPGYRRTPPPGGATPPAHSRSRSRSRSRSPGSRSPPPKKKRAGAGGAMDQVARSTAVAREARAVAQKAEGKARAAAVELQNARRTEEELQAHIASLQEAVERTAASEAEALERIRSLEGSVAEAQDKCERRRALLKKVVKAFGRVEKCKDELRGAEDKLKAAVDVVSGEIAAREAAGGESGGRGREEMDEGGEGGEGGKGKAQEGSLGKFVPFNLKEREREREREREQRESEGGDNYKP